MSFKLTLWFLLCLTIVLGGLIISIGPGGNLFFGPTWENSFFQTLVLQIRLPRLLTAFFTGGSLGLVALLLQTYFQNPLAGPFVLGIHSGAALGVAISIFLFKSLMIKVPWIMELGQVPFAFIGAMMVCATLFILMQKNFSKVLLLVVGLVFGYFISGIINILVNLSSAVEIKNFVLWNLGSFDRVQGTILYFYILIIAVVSVLIWFKAAAFNALMLGEQYAKSLGVNILQIRRLVLLGASVLTALVISFCGPIAFIGIISPHLLRKIVSFNDHHRLFPLVFLLGGCIALLATFIASSLSFQLPLNAVLGLLGAPILFFIIYKQGHVE